jgi:outer membrane protein assembly factor BamB
MELAGARAQETQASENEGAPCTWSQIAPLGTGDVLAKRSTRGERAWFALPARVRGSNLPSPQGNPVSTRSRLTSLLALGLPLITSLGCPDPTQPDAPDAEMPVVDAAAPIADAAADASVHLPDAATPEEMPDGGPGPGDAGPDTEDASGPTVALTVNIIGSGSVHVEDGALVCAADCTRRVPQGASLSLSVQPEPGYVLAGWEGLCQGFESCALTMDEDKSVTVRFVKPFSAWIAQSEGPGYADAVKVLADAQGRLVVGGNFTQNASFGGDDTLVSGTQATKDSEAFVASYDAETGAYRWSRDLDDFRLSTVRVDAAGDIYALGHINYYATIDGHELASNAQGSVLVKLSAADGSLRWLRLLQEPDEDTYAYTFAISPTGNVLVAGTLEDGQLGSGADLDTFDRDGFVLALDPANGENAWLRLFGGPLDQAVQSIDVAADGAIIAKIADNYESSLQAYRKTRFMKFTDATAPLAWSREVVGSTRCSIRIDASGDALLVGDFQGSIDLGGGPLTVPDTWSGDPRHGILLAKLAGADGAVVWSRAIPDSYFVRGASLVRSGDLLLAGSFSSAHDLLGSGVVTHPSGYPGSEDGFVGRISGADGSTLQVLRLGTRCSDGASSVAEAPTGVLYAAGSFRGDCSLAGSSLPTTSSDEMFLLRLNDGAL